MQSDTVQSRRRYYTVGNMACCYWGWCLVFMITLAGSNGSLKRTSVAKSLRVTYGNNQQEQHICTAVPLQPDKEEYIITFDPKADPARVLHLSVQVCDEIPGTENLWTCGEGVPGCLGRIRPVYVWGMNSTIWRLPPETGIPVGGESGGRFIVLQAHIRKFSKSEAKSNHPHYAEVQLRITKQRPRFEVGLMILGNTGFIPPNEKQFVAESACQWRSTQSALILGYRLHTHKLGRWIEGFAVTEDGWQVIGDGKPLSPENVHRSYKNQILKYEDFVASRCYYENLQNDQVNFGSGYNDEMCNFHLLYIFPYGSSPKLRFRTCAQNAQTFHLDEKFLNAPGQKQNIGQSEDAGHPTY